MGYIELYISAVLLPYVGSDSENRKTITADIAYIVPYVQISWTDYTVDRQTFDLMIYYNILIIIFPIPAKYASVAHTHIVVRVTHHNLLQRNCSNSFADAHTFRRPL